MLNDILIEICTQNISWLNIPEAEEHAGNVLITKLKNAKISAEHIFCVFCAVVDLSGLQ
jgi:hypothetical protein